MYDGPIIDAHTHPMLGSGGQLGAQPHPPQAYRDLVGQTAIVRAAALTIAPAGDMRRTGLRNDAVLELANDSGGFFFPVCSVHPVDGTAALAELDRVAEAGCKWLKLHPNTQDFDVWIGISMAAAMFANGPFAEQFTWVLRKVGTDRIVFGSDYPLDDPVQAIRAVCQLGLSEPELAEVLYDNAAALLGN